MIKLGLPSIASTSAVCEPRTTATAATEFPGFRDDSAFEAYGTDSRRRRRSCWFIDVNIAQNIKTNTRSSYCLVCMKIYLHGISLGLTFAGLNAVKPPVISVSFAGTSAVLIPRTARCATTNSAGFLERAALWARHLIARGDG